MVGFHEELYFAMLEVSLCTHRKIPVPLAHTMIDISQKSLELWQRDERAAMRFAAMVLAGSSMDSCLTAKLSRIYYSRKGYWKGIAAISKLAATAKVSEEVAQAWLKKQAIWQIYLPTPQHVPRSKFDVPVPNEVHQSDLLFLPYDLLPLGQKTYKYALTMVDVASRYKEAEPLTSKSAAEVADALERIYKKSPLGWPKILQVDPGHEFMGAVSQLLAKHNVSIRRGRMAIHRDQGIVERFNRNLAKRMFGHQYTQEMHLPKGERSTEWVGRLLAVVAVLNREVTRLTGQKPVDAI